MTILNKHGGVTSFRRYSRLISLVLIILITFTSVPAQEAQASAGWNKDSKGWWYENDDGTYVAGKWKLIAGYKYYFNKKGYAVKGWQKIKGKTYHFDRDYAMQVGWQRIQGNYYYFKKTGELVRKKWIGNFYVNGRGIWTRTKDKEKSKKPEITPKKDYISKPDGWTKINDKWYYYRNGKPVKGWKKAPGSDNWYYFYTAKDQKKSEKKREAEIEKIKKSKNKKQKPKTEIHLAGTMATDVYIDGWYVTPTGKANAATKKAKQILEANGGTLRAAYDYASSLSYSGRTTYLESWGSAALANQGYNYGTGNCYVMAAAFYEMALCLGYDAHQVAGYVPSARYNAPHSWVEIDEKDGTWVYDPNQTMERSFDAFRIYYGYSGSWMYINYHRMN